MCLCLLQCVCVCVCVCLCLLVCVYLSLRPVTGSAARYSDHRRINHRNGVLDSLIVHHGESGPGGTNSVVQFSD